MKKRDDALEAAKSALSDKEKEIKQHLEIQERSATKLEEFELELSRRWRPSAPEIKDAPTDDDITLMAEVSSPWPLQRPSWAPFLALKVEDTILVSNLTGEGAPCPDEGMVMWFGTVTEGGEAVGDPGWFPARYVSANDEEVRAVKLAAARRSL